MNRQHGWTMWTMMLGFILIVFFAYLGMKLVPPYFDSHKLQGALETLADDPRAPRMQRSQVIRELDNILYIDYGHKIVDLRDSVSMEKTSTAVVITIDYEVVVHLMLNISALLAFKPEVEVPLR